MIDVTVTDKEVIRIPGDDYLGLKTTYRAHYIASQRETWLQLAVVVTEKQHITNPQSVTRSTLFRSADLGEFFGRHLWVVGASVAISADNICHTATGLGPGCHSTRNGEFSVVRVGDDDHGGFRDVIVGHVSGTPAILELTLIVS
jgi:hypothetical protein